MIVRMQYIPGDDFRVKIPGICEMRFRGWPALLEMVHNAYLYEDLYMKALWHPWAWCEETISVP